MVNFCLQLWKEAEAVKKRKKLTHDEIKRKLIESVVMNDAIKTDELTKKVQEFENSEKAAEVIQEWESVIRMKKKRYYSGRISSRLGF